MYEKKYFIHLLNKEKWMLKSKQNKSEKEPGGDDDREKGKTSLNFRTFSKTSVIQSILS